MQSNKILLNLPHRNEKIFTYHFQFDKNNLVKLDSIVKIFPQNKFKLLINNSFNNLFQNSSNSYTNYIEKFLNININNFTFKYFNLNIKNCLFQSNQDLLLYLRLEIYDTLIKYFQEILFNNENITEGYIENNNELDSESDFSDTDEYKILSNKRLLLFDLEQDNTTSLNINFSSSSIPDSSSATLENSNLIHFTYTINNYSNNPLILWNLLNSKYNIILLQDSYVSLYDLIYSFLLFKEINFLKDNHFHYLLSTQNNEEIINLASNSSIHKEFEFNSSFFNLSFQFYYIDFSKTNFLSYLTNNNSSIISKNLFDKLNINNINNIITNNLLKNILVLLNNSTSLSSISNSPSKINIDNPNFEPLHYFFNLFFSSILNNNNNNSNIKFINLSSLCQNYLQASLLLASIILNINNIIKNNEEYYLVNNKNYIISVLLYDFNIKFPDLIQEFNELLNLTTFPPSLSFLSDNFQLLFNKIIQFQFGENLLINNNFVQLSNDDWFQI